MVGARRVWCLAALAFACAGCGRLGFDAADAGSEDSGARAPDAGPDFDAGPPPPIGTISDDFDDGMIADIWYTYDHVPPGSHHVETGGELVIEIAEEQRNSYAGYVTRRGYDGRGTTTSIRVLEVGRGGATAQCYFTLVPPDDTASLGIGTDGTLLSAQVGGANLGAPIMFDPMLHKYWRFRVSDASVDFETSPNGTTWNLLNSTVTPAFVADAKINVGGGTNMPVSTPGRCRFDDFNR